MMIYDRININININNNDNNNYDNNSNNVVTGRALQSYASQSYASIVLLFNNPTFQQSYSSTVLHFNSPTFEQSYMSIVLIFMSQCINSPTPEQFQSYPVFKSNCNQQNLCAQSNHIWISKFVLSKSKLPTVSPLVQTTARWFQ